MLSIGSGLDDVAEIHGIANLGRGGLISERGLKGYRVDMFNVNRARRLRTFPMGFIETS